MKWFHWFTIFLGAWIILSPWLFGFYEINIMAWNNVIAGILIIVFTLWNIVFKGHKVDNTNSQESQDQDKNQII
ncbi:MAG: SPW repeat protein [Minisyncoccia bacterium]